MWLDRELEIGWVVLMAWIAMVAFATGVHGFFARPARGRAASERGPARAGSRVRRVSAGLGVLVTLAALQASGAGPELGAPTVTRLWRAAPAGATPVCTGAYVHHPDDAGAGGPVYLVTTRHCGQVATFAGRAAPEAGLVIVGAAEPGPGFAAGGAVPDLAIAVERGRGPGARLALRLAPRMPEGGVVWIHGFPFGVEHVTAARVLGRSTVHPGSVELRVVTGPATEAGPGSSGAPVLDATGAVVGVLWAFRAEDEQTLTAFVVPAEAVRRTFRQLVGLPGRAPP